MIKKGILAVILGLAGLAMAYGSLYGVPGSNGSAVSVVSVISKISALVVIAGLVVFFIGITRLDKNNPKKKLWLAVTIFSYILLAFLVYYNASGGKEYFEDRGYVSVNKHFQPTFIPDGYRWEDTGYETRQSKMLFRQKFTKGSGDDYRQFYVSNDDTPHGILDECQGRFKEYYQCDIVDGKNIDNIYCVKNPETSREDALCSVKLDGTIISVEYGMGMKNRELSRDDAVAILDSLVPIQIHFWQYLWWPKFIVT